MPLDLTLLISLLHFLAWWRHHLIYVFLRQLKELGQFPSLLGCLLLLLQVELFGTSVVIVREILALRLKAVVALVQIYLVATSSSLLEESGTVLSQGVFLSDAPYLPSLLPSCIELNVSIDLRWRGRFTT